MADKNSQAWLISDDILTKVKDELILEAIDLLREQIDAKRIDIKGYVPMLIDKPEEIERDLFIINNLISRAHEIRETYKDFTGKEGKESKDPETVARMEELTKFMYAVDGIVMLMHLSKLFEGWAEDTGKFSTTKNPSEVIAHAMHGNKERHEALKFVLESKQFVKNEVLDDEERKILKDAFNHK